MGSGRSFILGMVVFNHKITYNVVADPTEPEIEVCEVCVEFDDAFGVRRSHEFTHLADDLGCVRVGGTAMTSVDVNVGTVIGFDTATDKALVLAGGQVMACYHNQDEGLQIGDQVYAVEHMRNQTGEEYGLFDWLATKKDADFRLNAIRIMLFDHDDVETAVIHLDPYLPGCVRDGRL